MIEKPQLIFLLFALLGLSAGSVIFWSFKNGISPMPTSRKVKRKLMALLPDNPEGEILELGSGWGSLVFPLSKKYPSHSVIGIESSPVPYAISRIRQFFQTAPHLKLIRKNFFDHPLNHAGLIVCYLYPGAMKRLDHKLKNELRAKTSVWIVSNTFALPGWIPEKIVEVSDLYQTKIYLYRYYHIS